MNAARSLLIKYTPPAWLNAANLPDGFVPKYKIRLGAFPTPTEKWNLDQLKKIEEYSHIDQAPNYYIKREDLSDFVLSGNKIRKLEFLLADAVDKGSDCVITVGGIQSNHCRATAMAARRLGLEPYLLLRNDSYEITNPLEGNLLLDRLCGSQIHIFTPKQVQKLGGNDKMLNKFANELIAKGKKPYIIPLGGSNSLGTWGYIEAANEIIAEIQRTDLKIDDVVLACGTGGTAAGLALGLILSGSNVKVHPVCVSNDAEYFHRHINAIFKEFQFMKRSEDCLNIIDGYKGRGYNKNTETELKLLRDIAFHTSIFLDPAYTLKAARAMLYESPKLFQNRNVLFLHTGGVFGLWTEDKMNSLASILDETSTIQPLSIGNNTNNSFKIMNDNDEDNK